MLVSILRGETLSATKLKEKEKLILQYSASPSVCLNCQNVLSYERRRNKFCKQSCAALYNNALTNDQRSKKLLGRKPGNYGKFTSSKTIKNNLFKSQIVGPFTRVYCCKCKITGKLWYSPTIKTIHPDSVENKKLYSYQSRFTFSITDYPEWFSYASDLIKQHGWYSASNRKNNLSGCSRDHLYSVYDGFKHNIDPKILSHPANCRIVPHRQNQNKHSKSSITLAQLLGRINLFNNMYLGHQNI